MLFQWTDSYSVHITAIDSQHEHLVDIINSLADAMRTGKGKDIIGKIIEGLIDYTVEHFLAEEKLFEQIDFPETVNHKKEHEDFVQKVSGFKEAFDRDQLNVSVEVLNFLCDWMKNHILKSDKKYDVYIAEQGIKLHA